VLLSAVLVLTAGCRTSNDSPPADHPRLTAKVTLRDITFRSAALGRDMQYRVGSPLQTAGQKLPVVYLLHGGGGGFRDWSNYSDVANFAESGLLLVMPEGESSTTPTLSIRHRIDSKTTSRTM
jgi:poly(3-hydroxybutyrate) depolymerase